MFVALAAALVIAGVLLAVLSAGGSGHHSRPSSAAAGGRARIPADPSETAVAAAYLGLSRAQLRSKQRSGLSLAEIADASAGKSANGLLEALVSARLKRLSENDRERGLSSAERRARLMRVRRRIETQLERIPGYVGLAASAAYLGLSAAQLRSELLSGRSLARIADTRPGKSAAGLIDTRASSREAALEAAAASGRISEAKERALIATLRARITAEVTRTPPRA